MHWHYSTTSGLILHSGKFRKWKNLGYILAMKTFCNVLSRLLFLSAFVQLSGFDDFAHIHRTACGALCLLKNILYSNAPGIYLPRCIDYLDGQGTKKKAAFHALPFALLHLLHFITVKKVRRRVRTGEEMIKERKTGKLRILAICRVERTNICDDELPAVSCGVNVSTTN